MSEAPFTIPIIPEDPEWMPMTQARLVPASKFRTLEGPLPWLCDGYLCRHALTLLTGQPKIGKTSLLAALLARMGAGGELAGRRVEPGRAAVISEEGGKL
jgi:RecA-family ATPase